MWFLNNTFYSVKKTCRFEIKYSNSNIYFIYWFPFHTLILRIEMKSASKLSGVHSEYFAAFFISMQSYYEEPSMTPWKDSAFFLTWLLNFFNLTEIKRQIITTCFCTIPMGCIQTFQLLCLIHSCSK